MHLVKVLVQTCLMHERYRSSGTQNDTEYETLKKSPIVKKKQISVAYRNTEQWDKIADDREKKNEAERFHEYMIIGSIGRFED